VHIFSGAHNAGIRKKKAKPLKRGQRMRQQKGIERADTVKEQLDSKLKKSLGKLKTIKERSKAWEALNPKLEASAETRSTAPVKFSALDDEMAEVEGDKAESEQLKENAVPTPGEVLALPIHQPHADVPLPPEEEDEIL
jgi:predicted nuclease with TOPRIM domain